MSIDSNDTITKISFIYKKILLSFYKLPIVFSIFMCYNTSERKEGTVQWETKKVLKNKKGRYGPMNNWKGLKYKNQNWDTDQSEKTALEKCRVRYKHGGVKHGKTWEVPN